MNFTEGHTAVSIILGKCTYNAPNKAKILVTDTTELNLTFFAIMCTQFIIYTLLLHSNTD